MSSKYPAISDPQPNVDSLMEVAQQTKQAVEISTGQRKPRYLSHVTWQDLVDLGLIKASQIPR